ncbi:SdpI family protein [Kocuria rhizophila]|uniref:SdpI family protein n=1 Tax=Kocuria rhizophila TaxID=72000 RepID=UPI0021A69403|nr:SdpI family protein [Kocuria rhizophila]MCT1916744.1 SdpI family protein [Kocuria rhizophila]
MDESSVGALIGIVMSSAVLGFVYAVIRAAASGFVDHNGFIGIHIKATHRSDEAWHAGHAAALPVSRIILIAALAVDLLCLVLLCLGPTWLVPWLGIIPSIVLVPGLVPIVLAAKKGADAAPPASGP